MFLVSNNNKIKAKNKKQKTSKQTNNNREGVRCYDFRPELNSVSFPAFASVHLLLELIVG